MAHLVLRLEGGWGEHMTLLPHAGSVLVLFLLCTSEDFPGVHSFGFAYSWILLPLEFQYSMITQNGLKRFTHPLNGTSFLSL